MYSVSQLYVVLPVHLNQGLPGLGGAKGDHSSWRGSVLSASVWVGVELRERRELELGDKTDVEKFGIKKRT